MSDSPKYVLYHSPCPDGFGAALAAWLHFGEDAEYIPVRYGEDPPPMEVGSEVYIVDFSYKRDVLTQMAKNYDVIVLDHHKTAEEDLKDLDVPGLSVTFDMSMSGAVMAWKYFKPHIPVPELIRYIQDRDLWRFELPKSREVNAALSSYPKDFYTWMELLDEAEMLAEEGKAILRAQERVLGGICKEARLETLAGYKVPVVNCTAHISEVGHELLQLFEWAPFSVSYRDTGQGVREWSLRSRGDFDVSEIARQFGGGGHRAAAGFRSDKPKEKEQVRYIENIDTMF